MDIKTEIHIDLLEFFKTGKFDYLKLGQTKEWILNNFPDPDGYSIDNSVIASDIWFYGDFELHFNNSKLFLIYIEQVESLSGAPSLSIKRTFFDATNDLSLQQILSDLIFEKIGFAFKPRPEENTTVELTLFKSNVKFLFIDNEDEPKGNPNFYKLYSISLIDD